MDVITVETKAFKELMAKINVIANYVFSRQDDCKENEDDIWVDSYEVCTFLKISDRTPVSYTHLTLPTIYSV